MIRQRVDRHGNISELEPESQLPGCRLPVSEVGVIKAGTVKKWMAAKKRWDVKFASTKRRVQKQRAMEFAKGYQTFRDGEIPPPSALASRRRIAGDLREEKRQKSAALSLWAVWGSKHDEETIQHEKQLEEGLDEPSVLVVAPTNEAEDGGSKSRASQSRGFSKGHSRSRSRRRIVTDEHQTEESDIDEDTPAAVLHRRLTRERGGVGGSDAGQLTPEFLTTLSFTVHPPPVDETELKRPKLNGIAFPFSLKQEGASASMITLTSSVGVGPTADVGTEATKDSGVVPNEADIEAVRRTSAAGVSLEHGRPLIEPFVSAEENLPTLSSL
jgi:hypothetical protein